MIDGDVPNGGDCSKDADCKRASACIETTCYISGLQKCIIGGGPDGKGDRCEPDYTCVADGDDGNSGAVGSCLELRD